MWRVILQWPVGVLKFPNVLQVLHPWEELYLYYSIFQWKTLASWEMFFYPSATSLNGRLASDRESGVRTYSQGPSGYQSYDTRAAQWPLYSQCRQPLNLEVQKFYLQIICRDSYCTLVSSGLCFALLQYGFSPFTAITMSLNGGNGEEEGRWRTTVRERLTEKNYINNEKEWLGKTWW